MGVAAVPKRGERNRKEAEPLYRQIQEELRTKIVTGEWPPGTRVPPQRQLAELYGVNRSTIVYALGELAADGWLRAEVGRGTTVAADVWKAAADSPPPDWGRYVRDGLHAPNLELIRQINDAEPDPALLRLGTGELAPELLPSAAMQRLLAERPEGLPLAYPEPRGSLRLREAVSARLEARGIRASPSSVLIVSGALQGLQLIALGLLRQGATLLAEQTSYLGSVQVFRTSGVRLVGVPMDGQGMRDDEARRLAARHRASMLYVQPSFHNPTGIVMPERRREGLLQACVRAGLPIIEDDVYGDLWLDEPPPAALKARDRQGLVLYLDSVSKSLGPGLRIGWIAGPEPVIERLADVKMQSDYGSSSLSQHAVAEWLLSGEQERHLAFLRAELKARRDLALAALREHAADLADWSVPQGGFYIWLALRRPLPMPKLFDAALRAGLLVHPGEIYARGDRQHLRLSFAYAPPALLREGIRELAGLIRSFD
ncbi:PLP-dependent aminotransferase family protein [Paenibacillus pasadenensis]|uniref:aminotransferase-like domain-containing protein n=1 Tax=Paenibacillus TaxID=44249 RepID=UPI00069481DE|nr:PLP-dependent aminotransferase family protein [Paenibacillus pasadenensis]QGG56237.1 aminotransferase class I/II-fold pyridoxal phosphate-dependent enzyme [Paenibacillus sp. B01]